MITIIPILLYASVGWFLFEPASLLASFTFSLLVLIYLNFVKKNQTVVTKEFIILVGLFLSYVLSALVNRLDFQNAIVGQYKRNFGLASIFALILLFFIISNLKDVAFKNDFRYLNILSFLVSVHGILQFLNFDPLPWSNRQQGTVILTFGNQNYASVLLSMILIYHLVRALNHPLNTTKSFPHILMILVILFLITKSGSLQAIPIIFVSIIFILVIKFKDSTSRISKFALKILFAIFLSGISLGVYLLTFGRSNNISKEFLIRGNVEARMDYMRTGIEMWKDHFFFGVGPDQFWRYSGVYRTPETITRDTPKFLTDHAHNTYIQHFANGGVFAGVLFLIFVYFVFRALYGQLMSGLDQSSLIRLQLWGAVWLIYCMQALVNPDNLRISVFGFIAAGVIFNSAKKNTSRRTYSLRNQTFTSFQYSTMLVLFIFCLYSLQNVYFDAKFRQIYQGRIIGISNILQVIDESGNYRAAEVLASTLLKSSQDCTAVSQISNRMIVLDDRSSQGYFFGALCAFYVNDYSKGIKLINSALVFDPLNTDYLYLKASVQIRAKDKVAAKSTLEIFQSVDRKDLRLNSLLREFSTL